MGLTQHDLQQIRAIMQETIRPLEGKIDALYNDIKEPYEITKKLEKQIAIQKKQGDESVTLNLSLVGDDFESLPPEEQTLKLYRAVVMLARKQGVALPE